MKEYWNWRYQQYDACLFVLRIFFFRWFKTDQKKGCSEENYEWFKGYKELKPVFSKYIKKEHKVLVVGCGNSELSADLYDDYGSLEIVNIDFSEIVIQKMATKNQRQRPFMSCEKCSFDHIDKFFCLFS